MKLKSPRKLSEGTKKKISNSLKRTNLPKAYKKIKTR